MPHKVMRKKELFDLELRDPFIELSEIFLPAADPPPR